MALYLNRREKELDEYERLLFGEDEDYNQADANGFINLFGLPIAERAKLAKNWPTQD